MNPACSPELEEPEVKKAMLEVIRFWLDKGVDGFRVDVIWHLMKDELFRNRFENMWKEKEMQVMKSSIRENPRSFEQRPKANFMKKQNNRMWKVDQKWIKRSLFNI